MLQSRTLPLFIFGSARGLSFVTPTYAMIVMVHLNGIAGRVFSHNWLDLHKLCMEPKESCLLEEDGVNL